MSGPPFSFNAEDAEDAEERRELRAEKGRSFLHPERDHQIFVTLGVSPACFYFRSIGQTPGPRRDSLADEQAIDSNLSLPAVQRTADDSAAYRHSHLLTGARRARGRGQDRRV